VSELSAERFVAELLPKLRSARVTYFPIRHHSPACASHLRRWILNHRPASVLVEGPESFTAKIELLTDERCLCPVALYTNFVDKRGRLRKSSAELPESPFGPPRFAAFYPFCDYSPELVALRTGRAVGARLRFIDLEYAEMILARHASRPEEQNEGVRVESLAADPHLLHSEYVQALARRLGCRDFNEVWDHLFEASADEEDSDAFMDRVATYCAMARFDYTPTALEQDGTTAREACMAAAVRDELRRNEEEGRVGPLLVVTGGFHTVALPDLVAQPRARPTPLELGDGEAGTWLMRYGFEQLDALAGYASGMPSPAFYDRLWHLGGDASAATLRTRAAVDLIVEIGRLARERKLPTPLTTPDAIAAVQMAKQLAALRGHAWPLREDVLDGVRACFVKGEMGAEGQLLMRLVYQTLAGNRLGQTPPGAGVPPIVDDFYREARQHRLPVDSTQQKKLELDLYRNARDRQISRLLHRLDLLGVPFAGYLGGPDFLQGRGLELMQEHWQLGWSPTTESALIEASIYGPTVAEAAAARLRQDIARLQEEGEGRSTAAAVGLLVRACRLGLHDQAGSIVPLIDVHIAEDPSFPSVVSGLSQLDLLAHAREPLEAAQLTALPRLTAAAYRRACRLLSEIATCPDEAVDAIIGALRSLREVLAGARPADETMDPNLFHQELRGIIDTDPQKAQAAVVGAAAGILYGEGLLPEEGLIRVTRGYLGSTASDPRKSCGILRGLLATAREIAWQVTEVIRALDAQFQSWDEKAFLEALPELRLAFTDLTPREIARVADHVAGLHGEQSLGELVHADLDEGEVRFALEVTRLVRESLRADGI
jgi:hypothetical protein